MAGKTVLVLGGGVGGTVAANRLRARLAQDDRVVVVDKSRDQLFAPSLLWLLVGARQPDVARFDELDFLPVGLDYVVAAHKLDAEGLLRGQEARHSEQQFAGADL